MIAGWLTDGLIRTEIADIVPLEGTLNSLGADASGGSAADLARRGAAETEAAWIVVGPFPRRFDPDFVKLRGYPPFEALMRPKT